MKKNDKYILLAVLGVLIVFCAYRFVYKTNIAKAEEVKIQSETLQLEVDKLEELEANKQTYIDDTALMKQNSDEIIECFPGGLLTEDEIMYYNNMELEKINQVAVPIIKMELPTEFPYVGETTVGEYEIQDDGILMYDAKTGINLGTTYNGLKNVIRHIYEEPGRKAITDVNLTVNEEGYLVGDMAVDFYYLKGTSLLYSPTNIPPLPLGTDNIFGSLEGKKIGLLGDADVVEDEDADSEANEEESEDEE